MSRIQDLVDRSVLILKEEGIGAFLNRLVRWLGGERRYYNSNVAPAPSKSEIVPNPEDMQLTTGSTDATAFFKVGEEFLGYFKDWCELEPDDHVLDVGSGIGRAALPLTKYLNTRGSYDGIEIFRPHVEWCQQNITPQYPNFRFHWADLYNSMYNREGKYQPEAYRFPFKDNRFDLVVLMSVFTHLLPHGMENYLSEISRVMKKGGYCLITYFILNPEIEALIDDPSTQAAFRLPYRYPDQHYAVEHEGHPEDVTAYYEAHLRTIYRKYNLEIVEPIRYGIWSARSQHVSFQDIVVGRKV